MRIMSGDYLEDLTKVRFTNLSKVIYPNLEIKKSKIIKYYIEIAPKILDFLKDPWQL